MSIIEIYRVKIDPTKVERGGAIGCYVGLAFVEEQHCHRLLLLVVRWEFLSPSAEATASPHRAVALQRSPRVMSHTHTPRPQVLRAGVVTSRHEGMRPCPAMRVSRYCGGREAARAATAC
jgi:hypothetical protein